MRWSPLTVALRRPLLIAGIATLFSSPGLRAEFLEPVIVSSDVSRDYHRVKLADGTFRRETFTFVKGSRLGNDPLDLSIDHLQFIDFARMLARPLAKAGYVPGANPKTLELMIMIHWGMTNGSEDPHQTSNGMSMLSMSAGALNAATSSGTSMQLAGGGPGAAAASTRGGATSSASRGSGAAAGAGNEGQLNMAMAMISAENHTRDQINAVNANILGMSDGLEQAQFAPSIASSRDTVSDLEMNRYYVVLQAFDFQKSWKEKKLKLLWETRFSIRAPGRHFDAQLANMIDTASAYFGKDSHGMHSGVIPNGTVEVGVPRVIGTVPDPTESAR